MHKTIKSILMAIVLVTVIIATMIEIEKVLNFSEAKVEQDSLNSIAATAPANSFVGGSVDVGGNSNHMYTFIPDGNTYCAGHGWTLTLRKEYTNSGTILPDKVGGKRKQEVTYEYKFKTEMAQSIAYIRAFNGTKEQIQNIVWESKKWKDYTGGKSCLILEAECPTVTTETSGIMGRATQFANFVYRALNSEQKLNLSITNDDVKILVDQRNTTYTVGPYAISFENQNQSAQPGTGSISMGELVYREILEDFDGWTSQNAFCVGRIEATVYYENGSSASLDQSQFEIIDEDGNAFRGNFPMFGQKFYIRYNSGDAEIKSIKPVAQVNYLRKITNNGSLYYTYTYRSKHIKFKMLQDQGRLFREAVIAFQKKFFKEYSDSFNQWIIMPDSDTGFDLYHFWLNEDNPPLEEQLAIWKRDVTGALASIIQMRISDWGVNDVDVVLTSWPGIIFNGKYIDITGTPFPSYEEVESEETKTYTLKDKDGNYEYNKTEDEKNTLLSQPGGTWEIESTETSYYYKYKCKIIIDGGTYEGIGEYEGTTSESQEDVIDEAKDKALKELCDSITVFLAMRVTDITIDADIEKVQPAVKLDKVTIFSGPGGNPDPGPGPGPGGEPDPGPGGTLELERWKLLAETRFETEFGAERVEGYGKEINMYIGGNVWEDLPSNKTGDYTGIRRDDSIALGGIQVQLYDNSNGTIRSTTTTDKDGNYGFQKINPMHKYKIIFTYDGMRFEDTKYTNDLSGGYSTAKEEDKDRNEFNDYFDQISSSPQNYNKDGEWRKAYRPIY